MKNSLLIYGNSLKSSSKEEARGLLSELSFSLAKQVLSKDEDKLNELLNQFIFLAKEAGLDTKEDITTITQAIIKASIEEEKQVLFRKLSEIDSLEQSVARQKELIKTKVQENFKLLEENLNSQGLASKSFLEDAKLCEVEILGILKETAESAYLTTLEKGSDIELTAKEITRSLIYSAINEGSFEKKRVIKITSVVLEAAFEIANETKLYANTLCMGAIMGAYDAVADATQNYRSSFAYSYLPQDIKLKEKELIYVEDDFIFLLRYFAKHTQNPVKDCLKELLDERLDSISAKFQRALNESKEELFLRLNELKQSPKVQDFSLQAKLKLNDIKQDISSLDVDAKELGLRLWQRAKNLIKKG